MDINIVKNWGLPEYLSDQKIRYSFENDQIYGVTFRLIDKDDNEIFYMDFYQRNKSNDHNLFGDNLGVHMRLQAIKTNTNYRRHGIATFYIKRLVEYCEQINVDLVTLEVAPLHEKNALNASALKKFYESFSTNQVDIKIINIIY